MNKEFILDIDNLSSQIKYIASLNGLKMKDVKLAVNELFDKKDSVRNLSNKFRTKTIRVSELSEIAEILNYEIVLRSKD